MGDGQSDSDLGEREKGENIFKSASSPRRRCHEILAQNIEYILYK